MSRNKKAINFLEMVPIKTNRFEYEVDEDGLVQIIIPRNNILDKIVRPIFKTPKVMRIDLDMFGSYVWTSIDDKRNVLEIGNLLLIKFGKSIEPVYERLGKYLNILRNNKFIKIL